MRPARMCGIALLTFVAASCGGRAGSDVQSPAPAAEPSAAPQPSAAAQPSAAPQPAAGSASAADVEAVYRARKDSARERYTDADVRFMTGMIHHHAQAVVMSRLAPSHGAGSSVQTLAARIINSQQDEIALMQRWLRDVGKPVPEVHIMGTDLMVGGGPAMQMPGMLTPEQMHDLDAARDTQFDRLFLTYMIQHHSGALVMVHGLFSTDGAGQNEVVFKFATDVQADQSTEIARMKGMLATLQASGDAR